MNRKIILTGAGTGIGRAAALRLAKERDELLLAAFRHEEALREVQAECEALGARVHLFTGDLSKRENISRLVSLVKDVFGTPDVLINNLGISHVGLFQEESEEAFRTILETNLVSAVTLTREIVKLMLTHKCGRIVNVSSVYGETGASCEVDYSLTKGGINALTRALGKELAPSGIQVNAIAPGAIDTGMNARLTEEERRALEQEIPMCRMGTPEEVADMIALLLETPLYFTAQVVTFDGGWT